MNTRKNIKPSVVRVMGVPLNGTKKAFVALRGIYGIGKNNVFDICKALKIDANQKLQDVETEVFLSLKSILESMNVMVEGDLRAFNIENIKLLKSIKCFRGLKHYKGSSKQNKSKFKKK